MRLLGVDFTSRPSRRKGITAAWATLGERLTLDRLDVLDGFPAFEALLLDGPYVGAFDFPFGLPRAFVETAIGPRCTHRDTLDWLERTSRDAMRDAFRAFCAPRPAGDRFAHRATDRLAGSSPSMKWVNPPVAYMLKEGAPRLVAAGLELPGLCAGDSTRIGLEAYPGMLARAITTASYKSDLRSDPRAEARRSAREHLVTALADGALGVRLGMDDPTRTRLLDDASGDLLDAVLCVVHAARAVASPRYGLPGDVDPIEGAIPLSGRFPRATGKGRVTGSS